MSRWKRELLEILKCIAIATVVIVGVVGVLALGSLYPVAGCIVLVIGFVAWMTYLLRN